MIIDSENQYPLPLKSSSVYQDQFLELPDWVNFIATDWNGEKYGFHDKPIAQSNAWIISFNWETDSESECVKIGDTGSICLDWKDSLIERKL